MNESETIMFISLKLKANPPATVPSARGGGGGGGGEGILPHISYVRMRFPKRCRFGLLSILLWNRVWGNV